MVWLKQFLAIPLAATVIWLGWVLAQQSGADALVRRAFVLLLVAIASLPLVAGRWWHANGNKGIVVAALSLPTAGYLLYLGDEGRSALRPLE